MSEQRSLQDRVMQLELLLSHQEHLLQQLNDVVVQLRAEQDNLKAKFRERMQRLESIIERQAAAPDPDEKPPHY